MGSDTRVPAWFVWLTSRPLLGLVAYGLLLGYGAYALWHVPVEVLPRFHYPEISVIAHYPGASAGEVETLLTRPLERQLLAVPNVTGVRSVMGQGTLRTSVRFRQGTAVQQDLQAVNSALDRSQASLPAGVRPYAEALGNPINEVADYAVDIPAGTPAWKVQRAIQAVIAPALRALPGVQRVEVFGGGQEALWIQPQLAQLRRYNVALSTIARAVRQSVVLGPAGHLVLGHQDVLLQARHLPERVQELAQVSVPAGNQHIPLGSLARIVHTAEPLHNATLLDGRPTVAMLVYKQPGASTVPVTRAVSGTLQQLQAQLPSGSHWVHVYDQGHLVSLIGRDLGRNLLVGAVLAILVLFAVLGTHRGVWVLALSVPVALLTAVAGVYAAGHSLNLLTLGALSVAVGLLADDAIIVMESIYHRWEQGETGIAGVWSGLVDIAGPDLTGTLTTVSSYAPLLLAGGLAALFFLPFALAMTVALLGSLLVSLTLIPLALSRIQPPARRSAAPGARVLARLQQANHRLLQLTIARPLTSLGAAALLFGISILLLFQVPMNFLPLPNEGVLLDSFTLPPGTALDDTRRAVEHITRALAARPEVAHVFARIGSAGDTAYTERSFAGEIQAVLKPGSGRENLDAVAHRLQAASATTGVQQGFDTPTVERVGESLSGLPQPLVVTVYGQQIPVLRRIAAQVSARLRKTPALAAVFDNDGYPVTVLDVAPRTDALGVYGISAQSLYAQLRPALGGEVIARIPESNHRIDLYMRLADAPYVSRAHLRALLIHTEHGWTPLGQLAGVRLRTVPNQLRHRDGARAMAILATPRGTLGEAAAGVRQALSGLQLPQGYRVSVGGLYLRLRHTGVVLALAAAGALLLAVAILLMLFGSLRVPGILLIQVPLACTGGALALALSGLGLNAVGLVGFLTVMGISLNHGIVLLHRAQRNERHGMAPQEAIFDAVAVRFRPIVLTTLTAVLGMLPTALAWGVGAAPEQGLAAVVLGGVVWSSLLSTNLIPALYLRWHPHTTTHQAATSQGS